MRTPLFSIVWKGDGFGLLAKPVDLFCRRCAHDVSGDRFGSFIQIEFMGHLVMIHDSKRARVQGLPVKERCDKV